TRGRCSSLSGVVGPRVRGRATSLRPRSPVRDRAGDARDAAETLRNDAARALTIELPADVVARIAQRAADLMQRHLAEPIESWIGVDDAAAHLACPKSIFNRR